MVRGQETRIREILSNFIRGDLHLVIKMPVALFESAKRVDLLVGGLVLGGDFERALAVAKEFEATDETGAISFYLSLGFSRSGRYVESLNRIARLESMSAPGVRGFYFDQARGFYCYQHGDSPTAITHARSALAHAESSRDVLQPLFRILSLDLLGHAMIRTGANRLGVKTLRLARDSAVNAKHESFNHAISISILKYETLFGIEPMRAISRLYRALVELKPNDSYSRSELRLELVRQLILRGQLREARKHLEDSAGDILGSQNRLQTASLHLRLAWMARLEGRPSDALLALQSAETSLGPADVPFANNRELFTKIAYFRLSLFCQMGRGNDAEALQKVLDASNVEKSLTGLEKRIFDRNAQRSTVTVEDPFGNLMDRIAKRDDDIAKELLELGFFGLLLPMLKVRLGQTALILGAPGGQVIVLDDGEVRLARLGLSGLLGKLLVRLAHGSALKRDVIESVWGYAYESERHDRLLAVAVTRIRKALGGNVRWIELRGDRITLREQVTVRSWSSEKVMVAGIQAALPKPTSGLGKFRKGLRIRQLQVLDELATRNDVGVHDLVERFGISRASALRDLNELVDAGFVIRAGETRATRYFLGSLSGAENG